MAITNELQKQIDIFGDTITAPAMSNRDALVLRFLGTHGHLARHEEFLSELRGMPIGETATFLLSVSDTDEVEWRRVKGIGDLPLEVEYSNFLDWQVTTNEAKMFGDHYWNSVISELGGDPVMRFTTVDSKTLSFEGILQQVARELVDNRGKLS